ncbi:hypothetical protein AB2N08_04405 [Massilia aurea]|uniref:hypothetical protein n=1 Tax=Massilia aurea TaxID=373040 RepID=UPI003461C032
MHGSNKIIIAALSLAAASSGQAEQQAMSTPAQACPAQDISFFIQRFATDEAVQRVFTAVPQRELVAFPVLPLAQERADGALGMRLEEVTTLSARLDLFKADTDYLISYFFKLDDCWRLVRIANQSL